MAAEMTGGATTLSSTDSNNQTADSDAEDTDARSPSTDTTKFDHNSNAPSDEARIAALHDIVQSGIHNCADDVAVLLSSTGVDVNAETPSGGYTALHLAARLNDEFDAEEVSLQLLKHGADHSIKDESLRTAADYAFSQGYVHLGDYLLFGGTSVDEAIAEARSRREEHFSLALLQVTKSAMIDDIRTCLERGANVDVLNEHGVGPLHFAVARCPADRTSTIVELLVNGGADVNLTDQEGDTALNLVIKCGSYGPDGAMVTLAKYLLEKGTNYELKDLDGKDARMLATERQYDDVVSLFPRLQQQGSNSSDEAPAKEAVAAMTCDVLPPEEVAVEETQRGAIPDEATTEVEPTIEVEPITEVEPTTEVEVTATEESTLHLLYAALKGGSFSAVMRHLADNENNINTPDEDDNAPIHLVVLRDNDDSRTLICENLLEHGADLNLQRQKDGKTALHLAVEKTNMSAVQMLLDAKPDINITSQQGETPYDTAVRLGHTEAAQMIKAYRVKMNAGNMKESKSCLVM